MRTPTIRRKAPAPGQRGQVFIMVALLLAVFGGMVALAIDVGAMMVDRRNLQNSADAIALAAAIELPDQGAAQDAAEAWAGKNGIDISQMQLTFVAQNPPSEPNPKVIVEVTDVHEFFFAPLIGISEADVGADAAAIRTSAAGGDGVIPLSVTEDELQGVTYGEVTTLKYDAQNILQGNTSPIRIDGPGSGNCTSSDNYCYGVQYGANNTVCSTGSDPTYCTGPTTVSTEPGNKVGGTRTAVNNRIQETDAACDEFDEVFEDDPTTADPEAYRIVWDCNPYLAGGYESHRVLIIPVIETLCNGACTVTIVDFALFYLEGFETPNSCTGNDCEVLGRFVRVNQNVGLLAGTFDEDAANTFVRLVD